MRTNKYKISLKPLISLLIGFFAVVLIGIKIYLKNEELYNTQKAIIN